MEGENRTPKDDVDTEILGDRNMLNDTVGRVLDNENSDIDAGREPTELGVC